MNGSPRELPGGIGFFHPASLLGTWFGSGLLPAVPGTWGSAAALPFAWVMAAQFGSASLLIAAALLLPFGIWASNVLIHRGSGEDPGIVVIDEVVGQWITLSAVSPGLISYGIGFILFRIFDVLKPWPANSLDRNVRGGLGVMADDIASALYAALVLWGMQELGLLEWTVSSS